MDSKMDLFYNDRQFSGIGLLWKKGYGSLLVCPQPTLYRRWGQQF